MRVDEMTIRPLAGPADQVAVATFNDDRSTITMFADEANGGYATSTRGTNGMSTSTGGGARFDPSEVISRPTSRSFEHADGAESIRVETSGIVDRRVASVEVEFIDGSIVTIEPTDFSNSFDVEFFVMTADVELGDRRADTIVSAVTKIRADDADGSLLGRRPGDMDPFVDEPVMEESATALEVTDPSSPTDEGTRRRHRARADVALNTPLPSDATPGGPHGIQLPRPWPSALGFVDAGRGPVDNGAAVHGQLGRRRDFARPAGWWQHLRSAR